MVREHSVGRGGGCCFSLPLFGHFVLGAGCTGPSAHPAPLPAAHIADDALDLLQHVTFQSSNFENILTWDSGLENGPDIVYSVEYKT